MGFKNAKTRTGKDYPVIDGSGRDLDSRVRFPLALIRINLHHLAADYINLHDLNGLSGPIYTSSRRGQQAFRPFDFDD